MINPQPGLGRRPTTPRQRPWRKSIDAPRPSLRNSAILTRDAIVQLKTTGADPLTRFIRRLIWARGSVNASTVTLARSESDYGDRLLFCAASALVYERSLGVDLIHGSRGSR